LAGKKGRIELRCAEMPKGRALDLLNAIHDQLALQEIRVEVIVEDRSGSCGDACACHYSNLITDRPNGRDELPRVQPGCE
jgi:hypothetical protein